MAEIIISVAAKLAEYLVGPALREGQYLFCTGKIKRNLESKKEELILTQGRVQRLVEEALNRTEEIDGAVKKWKSGVKEIIAEVEKLEQELKANNGCVRGWCPTWMRYHLCKQLAKKTLIMIQLNTNSVFNPFSHPTLLPDTVEYQRYFSSGNFMFFQSTKLAFDQLLEALGDESFYMIGLYGMGGAGKTTLAKEVGKKAKELKLFDRVFDTTISKTPHVRNIQGEISDFLGLKIEEESEAGRAGRLLLRLNSGERILIILDDIWEKLKLEEIGIPVGGSKNKCKLLLTTRRQRVCTSMGCQRKIPLHLLSDDEGWTLFQKHANVNDATQEAVAREVARECKGLPIAIVAVGNSLKEKSIDDLNVVLDRLRHAKPIDVDDDKDAFACLEVSYDYLKSEEAKLLFLMCAMFPEDQEIFIEDLFRFGMGLGQCKEADSYEIAREEVKVATNILVDSCLLMHSEKSEDCFKMHDVVRDLALWKATKVDRTIIVNPTKDLSKLAEDGVIKNSFVVSLKEKRGKKIINKFAHELDAPKLEILLLSLEFPNNENSHLDLSNASFNALKVMAVTNEWSYLHLALTISLPQSVAQRLTNLRTLRLVGLELGEISFVVSLTRLEILDLRRSKFKELPNGIENLNRLKLLDLSSCEILVCCDEVLARCSKLEELYVYPKNGLRSQITSYEFFRKDTSLQKLQRYQIQVGKLEYLSSVVLGNSRRSLSFEKLDMSTASAIIKSLLQRAEYVHLKSLKGGCKSIIPELVQPVGGGNHNELKTLQLHSCSEIKCLCNTTLGECNLRNLKEVKIVDCPQLTSLFSMSAAQTMLQLEKLEIENCSELKCIIINGNCGSNRGEEILPASLNQTDNVLPLLKVLKLNDLPNLLYITPENYHPSWSALRRLEWANCPKLTSMCLSMRQQHRNSGLEAVVMDSGQLNKNVSALQGVGLGHEQPSLIMSQILSLRYLRHISLDECVKLKFVFSVDIHRSLPELESLVISNCEELEDIFLENEEPQNLLNEEPYFPRLAELHVRRCNKLKTIFSITMARRLPQLRFIWISEAAQLEEIFRHTSGGIIPNGKKTMVPNLEFIHLKKLPSLIDICQGLKLQAVKLQTVVVKECPKLFAHISEVICYWRMEQFRLEQMIVVGMNGGGQMSDEVPTLLSDFYAIQTFDIRNCGAPLIDLYHVERVHVGEDQQQPIDSNLVYLGSAHQVRTGPIPSKILCPQYLQCLELSGCGKLKYVLSVQESLPELSSLFISDCYKLEQIFADNEEPQNMFNVKARLPKLQKLKVVGCSELKFVFSFQESFPELSSLFISDCHKLQQIFADNEEPQNMFNPKACFPKLHELEVVHCNKLKFVFSLDNIIKVNLPALTTLRVSDCDEVEEIIAGNEEDQPTCSAQVCFPQLKDLEIKQCNNLRRLSSTTMARMLPKLHSLSVAEAAQLKELFGGKSEDENSNKEEVVLPNLTEIKLKKLPLLINFCQGLKVQAGKLCKILIHECPKFGPILGSTQRIALAQWRIMVVKGFDDHQLCNQVSNDEIEGQKMVVISRVKWLYWKHLHHVMSLWNGPTLISFLNLQELKVAGCSKMKCIFSAAVIRSLPQLIGLIIEDCDELEGIISDAENEQGWLFPNPSNSHSPQDKLCFPKLEELTVRRCSKLKCVMSLSTTNAELPRLWRLEIAKCCELEKVFACASDQVECEGSDGKVMPIVLPKLKHLILKGLPILTDICGSSHSDWQLPALGYYFVDDCPKVSSTTIAALKHFKRTVTEEEEEEDDDDDDDDEWFGEDSDLFEEDDKR